VLLWYAQAGPPNTSETSNHDGECYAGPQGGEYELHPISGSVYMRDEVCDSKYGIDDENRTDEAQNFPLYRHWNGLMMFGERTKMSSALNQYDTSDHTESSERPREGERMDRKPDQAVLIQQQGGNHLACDNRGHESPGTEAWCNDDYSQDVQST
jgi:hypothetical protein